MSRKLCSMRKNVIESNSKPNEILMFAQGENFTKIVYLSYYHNNGTGNTEIPLGNTVTLHYLHKHLTKRYSSK